MSVLPRGGFLSGAADGGGSPNLHASTHENGGSDEISVAGLSGLLGDAQTPTTHAASHQNGGGDEISVTGLSGLLADAQVALVTVEANTAGVASPNIITAAEKGSLFTNEGTAALNYHTLPTAVAGLHYEFHVQDANGMRITANTGDTIELSPDFLTAAAGYIESTTPGSSVRLVAINASEWIAIPSAEGQWTDGTLHYSTLDAHGSIYWATPAATELSAATPALAAGTTAAQGQQDRFTAGTANRLTYTGKATRNFLVSASLSISAGVGTTTSTIYLYKGGVAVTGASVDRYISGTDVGAVSLQALISLATNEYVEVWVATNDGDDLTVGKGVLSAIAVGN